MLFIKVVEIAKSIDEHKTSRSIMAKDFHDFALSLQNNDVQYFDVTWGHALFSVSEMPSDMILEGLYKSKLQNSAQLRTVMALYDQDGARNNGTPNYHLKTAAKLHVDQMMRTRNFKARNDAVERVSYQELKKRTKPTLKRKWECVLVESAWTMFQRRLM